MKAFYARQYLSCMRYICMSIVKQLSDSLPLYATLSQHVLELCNETDPEEFEITHEWVAYQYTLQNVAIDNIETDSIIKAVKDSTMLFVTLLEGNY